MSSFIILLLFFLSFIRSSLVSVVELNRHGARTPKNFPELTESLFFGSRDMTLTINGYRQEQLLGHFVKSKYINTQKFLSPEFDPEEFHIIASPTQRTIFSAAGFLSGLFPDYTVNMNYQEKTDMTSDSLPPLQDFEKMKEIPVEVPDRQKDFLFHALNCKYEKKELKSYLEGMKVDLFQFSHEEISNTFSELMRLLGVKIHMQDLSKNFRALVKYYFPFIYHFKTKLNSLSADSWKTIKKYILNDWYNYRLEESKYLKLTSSAFFYELKQFFEKSRKSDQAHPKYEVLSGHDTLIVNIIANLLDKEYIKSTILKAVDDDKQFDLVVPPYACNIFFELHQEESDLKVKVIYDGRNITKRLNGNLEQSDTISYEKLIKLLSSLIEDDYKNLDCSELGRSVKEVNRLQNAEIAEQTKTKYFLK